MLWRRTALAIGLVVLFAPAVARAQLSPPATAMCQFANGKTITIEYSSPRYEDERFSVV